MGTFYANKDKVAEGMQKYKDYKPNNSRSAERNWNE